jgi:hypothetical protein
MLSVKDKMTLRLEREWFKYPAAKEARIRELFSESSVAYYVRLNALVDRPEALAFDPQVVNRLRRVRERRQRLRGAGRLGWS